MVPWFAWALLPLMLAMVLANNWLAQERFAVVKWLTLAAALYCCALWLLRPHFLDLEPLVAFKGLLATLGSANLLLLGVTVFYSIRDQVQVGAGAPSV